MAIMRLRAIQLTGNAGALLDSFNSRELSRTRELTPTLEKVAQRQVRRYDESGAIEQSGTRVRVHRDTWQRCTE